MGGVNCQNDILIECARMLCSYYMVGKSILCFRASLLALTDSIKGAETGLNGETL